MLTDDRLKPKCQRSILSVGLATATILTVASDARAAAFDDLIEKALKFGQDDGRFGRVTLDLRYRYAHVDTANLAQKPANANTFRLRLGYLTPDIIGFQGFAEFETLYAAQNDYNGVTYGNPAYQVEADPADKYLLNQFWLDYEGIPDTLLRGGRQRILLDDQRFIGNVGWRQLEQTFDAVMATNTSLAGVTMKAGYIRRVRTFTALLQNMETPFVNVNYDFGDPGSITGYGYWLQYIDDPKNFGKSSQTYGLRMTGSPHLTEDVALHYTAEYSYQTNYQNNPAHFALDRYNVMAGISVFGIAAKAAMEQLDGNGTHAFQTPLGTNHIFQGWADRFLVTPVHGIRDVNFTLDVNFTRTGSVLPMNMMFVYHNFKSATGAIAYGNEYDFQLSRAFGKHYSVQMIYAFYNGDRHAPGGLKNNTNKIWVQGNMSF